MSRRRCIIGVIGGDESTQVRAAEKAGAAITRFGQIVLTGGEPIPAKEVKNAALWGALNEEKVSAGPGRSFARMIGILKGAGNEPEWNNYDHPCRLILKTGLTSFERDPINGLTPDALVVFQGGRGTLCELAYAAVALKPIFYYKAVEQLRRKTKEHLADGILDAVFKEALGQYSVAGERKINCSDLVKALSLELETAKDSFEIEEIVSASIQTVFEGQHRLECTGFPGLHGEKERFENIVENISNFEGDV
jgi:predicted Rossmann-fold nucleotide-binding protein